MKRGFFYISLAFRDIVRLWRTTRYQIIIVTGICLPVLLLLGLKRGHVAELREGLVTSPTGRQIVCWSAQRGDLLNPEELERMRGALPDVEITIPEMQRIVRLETSSPSTVNPAVEGRPLGENSETLVTLYSTDVGDPILRQYSADILKRREKAVILSEATAKHLGLQVGQELNITIFRRRDGINEAHSFKALLKATVPSHGDSGLTGYANVELLSYLEQYVRGHAVVELGLPAVQGYTPTDEYESYLLYCQRGAQTDLSADDKSFLLERGIRCTELTDQQVICMHGVLNEQAAKDLKVYSLTQASTVSGSSEPLRVSPLFVTENTQAIDDFALRWNDPAEFTVDGRRIQLLGLSLPTVEQTGGWIRQYLAAPNMGFEFEDSAANPFQIQFFSTELDLSKPFAIITDAHVTGLRLAVKKLESNESRSSDVNPVTASPSAGNSSTRVQAAIPANCFAWMRQTCQGKLAFDVTSQAFTAPVEDVEFDKLRLYAKTIDNVPEIVAQLSDMGYAVLSESNRIAEIHSQDKSLEILVFVVGLGVFLFGTVTVIGVLIDATDRKRTTIGILRVMGVSRAGVFFVVILRALTVGMLAAMLSIFLGVVTSWIIDSLSSRSFTLGDVLTSSVTVPKISVVFRSADFSVIAAGAVLCAGLGALIPAWRASSIDPFEAIVEGKFH